MANPTTMGSAGWVSEEDPGRFKMCVTSSLVWTPERARNSTGTKHNPMSLRNPDGRQGLEASASPQGSTTPKTPFPRTLGTRQGPRASNQGRSKVHKGIWNRRRGRLPPDTTENRKLQIPQGGHSSVSTTQTKLRTLFKNRFQMGHPTGKEIHATTQIPKGELKVHGRIIRPSAHAGNHEAGPGNVQAELHQAEDREEQATEGVGDESNQQGSKSNKHRPKIQVKTQPRTKVQDRNHNRQDK